ncbi:MAG: AAA family ATPase [Prevotellaceae bacterium]|jgi:superfamily I DNA and/or RNA helicase|nr:AAA family ATPase [Prevotellaceae bacterium]
MMIQGFDFLENLIEINNEKSLIVEKYQKMRSLLEQVCKDLTSKESIQFSNLFSRLDYICEKKGMKKRDKFLIHRFRVNANNVLFSKTVPTEELYRHDLKALCNAISFFYGIDIPADLRSVFPPDEIYNPIQVQVNKKYDRIRVSVLSLDDQFIYASVDDNPTEEPIKIRHHNDRNKEFDETVKQLRKGSQLNLINVTVDGQGTYIPEIFIFEPDYLVDISSLAECMKEYGKHPLNYVKSKFEALKNTKHILLGNIANLFLDEFVNETSDNRIEYNNSMKKAFQSSPIEFSTCSDIDQHFFNDTRIQFQNIGRVVNKDFPKQEIDRNNAILEPSFICEDLGVQGRLDFLQLNPNSKGKKFVIELKSGKAPFPETDHLKIGLNHQSQAFIYQIILQKILGIEFGNLETGILYSKYETPNSNLRVNRPYMAAIKEILNIRNLIVINESRIAGDSQETQTREIIKNIDPENLITGKDVNRNFLDNYIIPQIRQFKSVFGKASELELEYFHSFYSFVAKEHYLSKVGDADHENHGGLSSLWLSPFKDKTAAGEILYDLTIQENKAGSEELTVKLKIPEYDQDFLPNFRQGDIVILYERKEETDNVTNKQIFKGTIQEITPQEITIRLRFRQRNKQVLPQESKYAVEHDFLDSSYNSMYRGLYSFLQANQDRKDLLLNIRKPVQDTTAYCKNIAEKPEIKNIVHKAVMAKDYFLLVGPPGTGKTSKVLKAMVEEFYSDPENNILLLSYTNRAVDEICDALENVWQKPDYIRIGSELSCEEKHRKRLLEKVIAQCRNRDEVKQTLQKHRIFAGTIASISNKTELFKLKHFQVAIVDEATQILEPHIIGILSAKDDVGKNAIDKFILIGDHKQLPAVVLQKKEDTEVKSKTLQNVGLTDRRNSLFERLYNLHKDSKESLVWGMLHKQGRMHPDIASFPNEYFYDGLLETVPLNHQTTELDYKNYDTNNPFHKLIATKRIAFIPSEKYKDDKINKVNTYEAKIVKELVRHIFELYKTNNIPFSAEETIGIITPYRSQIACIKREIHSLGISELNNITVDTVERFQGSQRDIIIYSFCVNDIYQLDFLAANTIDGEQPERPIDRKLNVAITRAKKQLIVTGNPSILWNNLIYYEFIEFIRSKSGYIYANPGDFINGKFEALSSDTVEVEKQIENEEDHYVSIIKTLRNPSFTKIIRTIKENCFQQCPGINKCLPWTGLNHGTDLLTSHKNLCKYLCAYGEMHEKKIKVALNAIPNFTSALQNNFSIIDWGCGQGLATVCFFDYLNLQQIQNQTHRVILIEPSEMALNRAKFHVNVYLNNENKIQTINKDLESIVKEDITTNTPITLHFFSNILDIVQINLKALAGKINANIVGKHYFICVGPLNHYSCRIDNFCKYLNDVQPVARNSLMIDVNGWMRGCKYAVFKIINRVPSHNE